MAITTEDVHNVANGLVEAGEKPTLAAIRRVLGGGSFTTISEAMKSWKAQSQATAAPIKEPAPSSLTERIEALGAEIWAAAIELANARLQSEREAMEAARLEMEQAQAEAAELADQLAADLEQLQASSAAETEQLNVRIDALLEQHEATRAEWQLAENQIKRLEKDTAVANAALEEAHHQIASMNGQIDDLKSENRALREQLLIANEALAKTQSNLVRIQATADAQTESFKAQRQAAAQEACRQAERYTKVQGELDQAKKEAGEARERAAELTGKLAALQEQNTVLLSKVFAVDPEEKK
ncbi:MAG: DNA-binding protein [Methylobacter sp.]